MAKLFKKSLSGKYHPKTDRTFQPLMFKPIEVKGVNRYRTDRNIKISDESVKVRYVDGKKTRTLTLPKSVIYDGANKALITSSIRLQK